MVNHTSGLICVPMPKKRLDELGLPLMVDSQENEEAMRTAFTVTVDARHGVSTGISAEDRAHTIRLLADPSTSASDFSKPGHILPLVYASGITGLHHIFCSLFYMSTIKSECMCFLLNCRRQEMHSKLLLKNLLPMLLY